MVSKTLLFLYILNNLAPAYLYSLKNRQTGIIIHITIAKLDRFFEEQKLLVILFCLRQLENGTNLTHQSVKLLQLQYFAKHS